MQLHSKEAEQNLLASLILDENKRLDLSTKITTEDFYKEKNKIIYQAIKKLDNKDNVKVDLVTLAEEVRSEIDGVSKYLAKITGNLITPDNAGSYAGIVKQKAIRRRMKKAGEKIIHLSQQEDDDIEVNLAKAEEMMFDLNDTSKVDRSYVNIKDYLAGDHLDNLFQDSEDGITGLKTPFRKLNEITGGLHGGELWIIAGQSGMGKTSLATNIINYVAKENKVGIFSLEMSKKKLVNRSLSELTGIEYKKLKKKLLSKEEKLKIQEKAAELYDQNNILINDTAGLKLQEIRSDARKMKKNEDVKLILVDYDDLIKGGGGDNEALRKQNIARSLRNMAKELDVNVMLLCQINRSYSSRNNKRPKMSDLKGSSGLENAADLILMLYRQSEFDERLKFKDKYKKIEYVTECIIAKGRENKTGKFFLNFKGQNYSFRDIEKWRKEKYVEYLKSI